MMDYINKLQYSSIFTSFVAAIDKGPGKMSVNQIHKIMAEAVAAQSRGKYFTMLQAMVLLIAYGEETLRLNENEAYRDACTSLRRTDPTSQAVYAAITQLIWDRSKKIIIQHVTATYVKTQCLRKCTITVIGYISSYQNPLEPT